MAHYSSVDEANKAYKKKVADAQSKGTKYVIKDGKQIKKTSNKSSSSKKTIVYKPTDQEIMRTNSDSEKKILYGGSNSAVDVANREASLQVDRANIKVKQQVAEYEAQNRTQKEFDAMVKEENTNLNARLNEIANVATGKAPKTNYGLKYQKEYDALMIKQDRLPMSYLRREQVEERLAKNKDYVYQTQEGNIVGFKVTKPAEEFMSVQEKKVFESKATDSDILNAKYGQLKLLSTDERASNDLRLASLIAFKGLTSRDKFIDRTKKETAFIKEMVVETPRTILEPIIVGASKMPKALIQLAPQKFLDSPKLIGQKAWLENKTLRKKLFGNTAKEIYADKDLQAVAKIGVIAGLGFTPIGQSIAYNTVLTGVGGYYTIKNVGRAIKDPTPVNVGLSLFSAGMTTLGAINSAKLIKNKLYEDKITTKTTFESKSKSSSLGKSKSKKSDTFLKIEKYGKIKGKAYYEVNRYKVVSKTIDYRNEMTSFTLNKASSYKTLGKYTLTQKLKGDTVFYKSFNKGKLVSKGSYPANFGKSTFAKPITQTTKVYQYGKLKPVKVETTSGVSNTHSDIDFIQNKKYYQGTKTYDVGRMDQLIRFKTNLNVKTDSVSRIATSKVSEVVKGGGESYGISVPVLSDKGLGRMSVYGRTDLYKVNYGGKQPTQPKVLIKENEGVIRVLQRVDPKVLTDSASKFSFKSVTTVTSTPNVIKYARVGVETVKNMLKDKSGSLQITSQISKQTQPSLINYNFQPETTTTATASIKTFNFKDIKADLNPKVAPFVYPISGESEKINPRSSVSPIISNLNKKVNINEVNRKQNNENNIKNVLSDVTLPTQALTLSQVQSQNLSKIYKSKNNQASAVDQVQKVELEQVSNIQDTMQTAKLDYALDIKFENKPFSFKFNEEEFKPRQNQFFASAKTKKNSFTPQTYDLQVRRGGQFMKANMKSLTRQQALDFGSKIVDNTSTASFKIVKAGSGRSSKMFSQFNNVEYGGSYKRLKSNLYEKNGVFIEKKGNRISTAGEKAEITLKGIASMKMRGVVL